MKSSTAVKLSLCDLPTGGSVTSNKEQPTVMRTSRGVPQVSFGRPELSKAIDVVASLTEHAGKLARRGANELAMSEALAATFGYMVAYLHHVTIDHDEPQVALAKAAAGTIELTTAQLDFIRAVSSKLGPHTTNVAMACCRSEARTCST